MRALPEDAQDFQAVRTLATHACFLDLVSHIVDAKCTMGIGRY